jgi:GNAT superfamily N-acetyltransferase
VTRIANPPWGGYDDGMSNRGPSDGATPIVVRPARAADALVIVAFNQAMAVETEHKVLPDALIGPGVRAALVDPHRALYWLAEIGEQVAGQTMVTTEWSDWRNGFFWWIQSVYVAPRFRRQGVFRALHAFIHEEARRRVDVCGLRLYVHQENHAAIEVYRALGMRRTDYRLLEEDWSTTAD